ncbi:MAG TPA: GNAT family N-acetyltransferase [Gaiellaceae bacterium]|jgi:GNAT superfamily N-acetyltransferase|nr:GNAT family N-acetyltransferase [Gaiellaceae bacterium]
MESLDLLIRPVEDGDLDAVAVLLRAADDSLVLSPAGLRQRHATRPARAQIVELVAELEGVVVANGAAGLNTSTTTEGAAWAFVTVGIASRGQGIGDRLGAMLLEHLREVGATSATSFFRFTEEGERWAVARGWQRLLSGPLIALDPRNVPEPSVPPGFACVGMSSLQPEAVYDAVTAAALDEPTPVPNDDIRLDDFMRDWDDPDLDLDASTAVLAEDGRVAAFAFIKIVGDRAQHGFTGTQRDHRSRGLATAAKRSALRAAAARGVTRVTTSNAEENVAMRAINRKLGFEPIGEHVILGRDL